MEEWKYKYLISHAIKLLSVSNVSVEIKKLSKKNLAGKVKFEISIAAVLRNVVATLFPLFLLLHSIQK